MENIEARLTNIEDAQRRLSADNRALSLALATAIDVATEGGADRQQMLTTIVERLVPAPGAYEGTSSQEQSSMLLIEASLANLAHFFRLHFQLGPERRDQ